MFNSINPGIVFIDDKYINMDSVYNMSTRGLSIQLDYYSGEKELIQFGSKQELHKAFAKLAAASNALEFGTNYVPR
jgi:hypothetical protein